MDGPMSRAPWPAQERPQAMDGPVSLAPGMDKERLAEKTNKTG